MPNEQLNLNLTRKNEGQVSPEEAATLIVQRLRVELSPNTTPEQIESFLGNDINASINATLPHLNEEQRTAVRTRVLEKLSLLVGGDKYDRERGGYK